MGADIPAGGGPVGGGPSSDYEGKALDILNEGSEPEPESEADVLAEGAEDEGEQEPEAPSEPPPEIPEEEEAQETPEEPKEEPVDENLLTLSGKEAYDKLKKEFPDALKSNPALRQVFFREKAFSDIYTSVDEAREAAGNSEFLQGLSTALNNGNIKGVIETLSDTAKTNLAENFITALPHDLFVKATAPLIANILNDAFESAEQHSNQNLRNAVLHLSRFLTGRFELPKRIAATKKEDPQLLQERQQFENERRNFYYGRQTAFLNEADVAVAQGLNRLLSTGLDPSGSMSQFMKNAIIAETSRDLKEYVNRDKAFVAVLDDLYKRAQRTGFDHDSKSRLVSAYLGRVKDIALKIRANKVAEARKTPRSANAPEESSSIPPRRSTPQRNYSPRTSNVGEKKPMTELDVIRSR